MICCNWRESFEYLVNWILPTMLCSGELKFSFLGNWLLKESLDPHNRNLPSSYLKFSSWCRIEYIVHSKAFFSIEIVIPIILILSNDILINIESTMLLHPNNCKFCMKKKTMLTRAIAQEYNYHILDICADKFIVLKHCHSLLVLKRCHSLTYIVSSNLKKYG